MYAVAGPVLGRYIDRVSESNNKDISPAIYNIAGVQFTVLAAVIIVATFIPKGAFSINPKQLSGQSLQGSETDESHEMEFEDYNKAEQFNKSEDGYTAYVEADGGNQQYGHARTR